MLKIKHQLTISSKLPPTAFSSRLIFPSIILISKSFVNHPQFIIVWSSGDPKTLSLDNTLGETKIFLIKYRQLILLTIRQLSNLLIPNALKRFHKKVAKSTLFLYFIALWGLVFLTNKRHIIVKSGRFEFLNKPILWVVRDLF